jgi:transcriptional regulator with XRE-family HTH domain
MGVLDLGMRAESIRILTSAQLRAARAMIQLTQEDLASRSGVPRSAIAEFETDIRNPRGTTLGKLRAALEDSGVVFIDGRGVSGVGLRPPSASD